MAQVWTEVLFKRLLFFWNLHTRLSTEITHQGRPRPSFTLALNYFYAQGFRSWEGVRFIINYNLEDETSRLRRLCCAWATSLCGRGWTLCWINIHLIAQGFPCASDSKESACNMGEMGSTPGLGRSPAEGHGYPLQYSCLKNSMHRRAWQSAVHGITKSQTWLSD